MTSARPIGDLVTIVGGGTPTRTKAEFYGGGVPWVTPKDMKTWDITESQVMLTEEGVNQSPAKVIEPNAVLVVVRSGILKHTLPIAVNRVSVTLNQDMKALICRPGLHPDYLARYLKWRAPEILDRVRATTADNFPVATLRQLEIPVPALQEQRRIAAILDQADTLRTKRRASLASLDDLTRSAFVDMFGSGTKAGIQPVALGQVARVSGGKRLPKGSEYAAGPTDHPYVRVTDMKRGSIDETALAYLPPEVHARIARYIVMPGDVIISIAGSIGIVAAVPDSLAGANLTENAARIRALDANTWDSVFMASVLRTQDLQSQIAGRTGRVTIGKLALFRIEQLEVPLPPLSLQRAFRERVASVQTLRAGCDTQLVELDALFAALQQRAFKGEL